MKIVYPDFFYLPLEDERNSEDIEEENEFGYIDKEYSEEESEK